MNRHDFSALRPRLGILLALAGYAVAMRVLPYVLHVAAGMKIERAYDAYPWNFSPVFALAVFGGAVLSTRAALLLSLGIYAASDLLIAAIGGPQYGFYGFSQIFTYVGITAAACCGMPLRGRGGVLPVVTAGLAAPLAFFLVTNLGVWLTGGGWHRPLTAAGFAECFLVDAPPFFTPVLLSVAVFLPILFSPLALTRPARPAVEAA